MERSSAGPSMASDRAGEVVQQKVKGLSLRLPVIGGVFLAALSLFSIIADEVALKGEHGFDT